MDIIWAQIQGYKRFEQQSKINVENKLIALIGPNESGKSSVLAALMHLNSDEEFVDSGSNHELTRGIDIADDQIVVKGAFHLTNSDRDKISNIRGGSDVKWFYIEKYADGEVINSVQPKPSRDLSIRKNAFLTFQKPNIKNTLFEIIEKKADSTQQIDIDDFIEALESEEENLPEDIVATLQYIYNEFKIAIQHSSSAIHQKILSLLNQLIENEKDSPSIRSIRILKKLLPDFLFFSDEDRNLKPEYDMNEPFTSALSNLANLAGLDLTKLKNAINSDDQGKVETLVQQSNEKLYKIFEEAWSQSGILVHLSINNKLLHILVRNKDNAYNSIAERSEGLKHFVALLAFVSTKEKKNQKPILLIDEAENQLHYDEQADHVKMFAKQQIASKIIYSTHSIGCLPEDLGCSVRLMEPLENKPDRSKIKNWFWDSESVGFSPVLFGIGAKTMAYIPVRNALFAEGATDFILLPSLFREVTNRSYLGFQILPGLSEVSKENVPLLEYGAPNVAYLVGTEKQESFKFEIS